ncbi:T9SS type A sorting domain-containing protein, partial [Flavobacterium rhamnosiphilum]
LTVTPATLSIANTNRSKVYGKILTNTDFGGSMIDVVAGDNITLTRSSTGQGIAATVAGSNYPIVATLADPSNRLANYNVTNSDGALTVTQATTGITVTNASGALGGYTILTARLQDVSNSLYLNGKTVTFKLDSATIGTSTTDGFGVASMTTNACINGATIQADFAGDSNYLSSSSTNTATLTVTPSTFVWSGTNVTGTPQQLPTSGSLNITPTITFTGVTLTNVSIEWGDSFTTPISGAITNSVTSSHNYSNPGVYAPKITGTDVCLNTVTSIYQYIVIYDPNGGFVTGGGWINSPAGAYRAEPLLTGKANFGFVAKYKKGSTIPDGNTEFQFQAGNLKFNSSSYENMSLVVGGAKASYKGIGTINGAGSYKFMLTAIDGNVSGGGNVDKLRMKITNMTGVVIYDNQVNALNTGDNADPITALGGGSIVIHEAKKNTTAKVVIVEKTPEIVPFTITAYPNPSTQYFSIDIKGGSNEKTEVMVYDILGRMVKHIENGDSQEIKFGEELPSGTYIAIINQGVKQKTVRLVKK